MIPILKTANDIINQVFSLRSITPVIDDIIESYNEPC
jgi:hypothetical protein